jgi:hypothetical protein
VRICLLLVIVPTTGCMPHQLELTTRRTLNTLPDLQYQQVIDNLAMIASNPGYLPYLAVVGQGSIQVTDNGTSTLGLSVIGRASKVNAFSLNATRNITGTLSIGTITNPEKIRSMQAVYQRAVAGWTGGNPAYSWLNLGTKRDVPSRASHIGRHGNVAAWVMPEGIAGLSALTLEILDIATREDALPASASPLGLLHRTTVPRRNFQVPPTGPVFTPGGG